MVQEDALLLDMQTCEVINRVSSTIDLESLSVLSDLEKKIPLAPRVSVILHFDLTSNL